MRKISIFLGLALVVVSMSSCCIYQKIKFSNKDIQISNACEGETLDFKLISLIGDKEEQTMTLNCRLINRDINRNITVGSNLIAYDTEGVKHSSARGTEYRVKTDEKLKFSINIPGQVIPKKVKKMAVISFDIDDCHIEIKNVPIMWMKIKKEEKK